MLADTFKDLPPSPPPALHERPSLNRLTTVDILDYYNSPEAAGYAFTTATTDFQSNSEQASEPSSSSPPRTPSSPKSFVRTSLPSSSAADNRRLHIVELDASVDDVPHLPQHSQSLALSTTPPPNDKDESEDVPRRRTSLLRRRGMDRSLALVAPPDAAPASYTNLTPPDAPRSAPPRRPKYLLGGLGDSDDGDESELAAGEHRRSRSVADQGFGTRDRDKERAGRKFGERVSPRDGVVFFPPGDYTQALQTTWKRPHGLLETHPGSSTIALGPSYSSSPPSFHSHLASPPLDSGVTKTSLQRPPLLPHQSSSDAVMTPSIGEEKDPMARVAGPVVVGLGDMAFGLVDSNEAGGESSAALRGAARAAAITPSAASPSATGFTSSASATPLSGTSLPAMPRPASGSVVSLTAVTSPIGPPPPRPPRATTSRRIAQHSQPQVTVRPPLSTMDSDYSLIAVTASSSGNSAQMAASDSGYFGSATIGEVELAPKPSRHRREGAHTSTAERPDKKIQPDVETTVNGEEKSPKSVPHCEPTTDAWTLVINDTPPTRPVLTSRWSSWSSLPSDSSSGKQPISTLGTILADSLEDLLTEVDKEINDIGLMDSADTPPPTVVPPLKDIDAPKRPNGGRSLRRNSKSPALGTVAEIEVPTPSSSQPSTPPTADLVPPTFDLSSPAKTRPVSEADPLSLAGAGTKMGRMQSDSPQLTEGHESPRDDGVDHPHHRPRASPTFSVENTPPQATPHSPDPAPQSNGRKMIARSASMISSNPSLRQFSTPPTSRSRRGRVRGPVPMPPAMSCKDVLSKTTHLERCNGYAQKIKELLELEETGLGDWVVWAKSADRRSGQGLRAPSTSSHSSHDFGHGLEFRSPSKPGLNGSAFGPQLRNISHGSEGSESTFPVRADAYTATELSSKTGDSPPRGPPANLPYPGLAHNIGVRSSKSVRTIGSPGSLNAPTMTNYSSSMRSFKTPISPKTNGTGFFASIGRKASMKKDPSRPTLTDNRRGNGRMGSSELTSRPSMVTIGNAPSGGPRHPAATSSNGVAGPRPPPSKGLPVRNNSLLATFGRRSTEKDRSDNLEEVEMESVIDTEGLSRQNSVLADKMSLRSAPAQLYELQGSPKLGGASLIPRSSLSYKPHKGATDSAAIFNDSLEKLADVLPQVDRDTLAVYLRRMGGDDLKAIGAYLEDERNGTVTSA